MTEEEKREAEIADMRIWEKDISDERIERRLKDLAYLKHEFKQARYRVMGHDEYKLLVRPHRGNEYVVMFRRTTISGVVLEMSIAFDIEKHLRLSNQSPESFFDYWIRLVHRGYEAKR